MKTVTLRLEMTFDCPDTSDGLKQAKEIVEAINDQIGGMAASPQLLAYGKHGAGAECIEQGHIAKEVEWEG